MIPSIYIGVERFIDEFLKLDLTTKPSNVSKLLKQFPNYIVDFGHIQNTGKYEGGGLDKNENRPGKQEKRITSTCLQADRIGRIKRVQKLSNWSGIKNEERKLHIINQRDIKYNGYFYNNSHLVARKLGGSNRSNNLIIGTRFQIVGSNKNDGGMRIPENIVKEYLSSNPDGKIEYTVIPLWTRDEDVLPKAVLVKIKSLDTCRLNKMFLVLNMAYGYRIDYRTGKYKAYM